MLRLPIFSGSSIVLHLIILNIITGEVSGVTIDIRIQYEKELTEIGEGITAGRSSEKQSSQLTELLHRRRHLVYTSVYLSLSLSLSFYLSCKGRLEFFRIKNKLSFSGPGNSALLRSNTCFNDPSIINLQTF